MSLATHVEHQRPAFWRGREVDMGSRRRDFMKLAGLGGVVFASTLRGGVSEALASGRKGGAKDEKEFYFVQLSDTHWGFDGPPVNPDASGTLVKAVDAVNALDEAPDFVVFTGDLTHTTDDDGVRRDRMSEFRDIVSRLKAKTVYFMPGEHDAALDRGDVYQRFFGPMHYSFDHKGLHFVVLDNVSDPGATVGEAQIEWLTHDLAGVPDQRAVVVLTHRPLFDLYPQWDWSTRDGAAVLDVLARRTKVTVFYGHIHQEHHFQTGRIAHHAAKSLMFPLPAPGSVPRKAPVPWNAARPYAGLGFRDVEAAVSGEFAIREHPVIGQ
jgi:hypothetical protein